MKLETTLSSPTSEWREREGILIMLLKGLKNKEVVYFNIVQRNPRGLALQLCDLRSVIGHLTSQVIEAFAKGSPSLSHIIDYEKFSELILSSEDIVKGLGSANKVISSYA